MVKLKLNKVKSRSGLVNRVVGLKLQGYSVQLISEITGLSINVVHSLLGGAQ